MPFGILVGMREEITIERAEQLPKIQSILDSADAEELIREFGRQRVLEEVRRGVDELRATVLAFRNGPVRFCLAEFVDRLRSELARSEATTLRRVVNATGIVIHTNLGRVPLAQEAIEAISEVAAGYSNLEYDLDRGQRGSRLSHVEGLLRELTGAEAALVVNNNAAAVMLVLNTLALGKEVIVSRGEMVEIGGSFRIPEVIGRSGARLVEIGTTNKTHVGDYEHAITNETRVLMKVHPSNYRVVGFTDSVPREQVVAIAREHGLAAVEDLGSGTLLDLSRYGLPAEPTVQQAVAAGLDAVTFSGDKLLGGSQAGIVVGKKDSVQAMKKDPLIRALRIDKLSLAALDATLRLYRNPERLVERLPLLRMLAAAPESLERRARTLAELLNKVPRLTTEIERSHGFAGGGSLPDEAIPTTVVAIRHETLRPGTIVERLRRGDPPVVARIENDRVVFDVRTLTDEEAGIVGVAVRSCVETPA